MSEQTLTVRVLADIKDLKKGMSNVQSQLKETSKATAGITKTLKTVGKAAIAAFSVKAIVDFAKTAVETTAELRALDAQFDQTFKGDAEQAMARINSQSKEMNINVDRLKGGYSAFQGMFKGFGIEAESAMDLTEKSMRLAADAAAYYDKSLEDTSASLKSFMMGNLTAGDAIGVNYTGTMRDIDAKEKYGKAWKDLTQEQQSFLMVDVVSGIYEQSGAMGQAAREGNSWENTTSNLKATWGRLLEVVGSPILDVATVAIGKITEGVEWLTSSLKNVDFTSMTTGNAALSGVKDAAMSVVSFFKENWPSIKQTALDVFAGLQDAYNTVLLPAFNALMSVVQLVFGVFQSTWPLIQTTVGIAFDYMKNVWETVLKPVFQFVIELVQGIAEKFQKYMPEIQALFEGVSTRMKEAYESHIKPVFDKIGELVNFAIEKYRELSGAISKFVDEYVIPYFRAFVNMIKELYDENKDKFSKIQEAITVVIGIIKGIIGGLVDFIKTYVIPFLAVIYKAVTENMDKIKAVFQGVINIIMGILDVFIGIFTGDWKRVWEGVKGIFSGIWDTIKGIFSAAIGIINSILKGFGLDIGAIFNNIKTKITTTVTNIKDKIVGVFTSVKNTVTNIFNGVRDAITNPIDKAKGFIKGAIDAIKGFFGFKISWPKIPMPHFGINPKGWKIGDLLKGSIPKLAVDWYARGGIFTKPTILNGLGIGDASNGHGSAPEVVAPLSDLKQMLGLNDGNKNVTINLNGDYAFKDKEDMDYFLNRMALAARRI